MSDPVGGEVVGVLALVLIEVLGSAEPCQGLLECKLEHHYAEAEEETVADEDAAGDVR